MNATKATAKTRPAKRRTVMDIPRMLRVTHGALAGPGTNHLLRLEPATNYWVKDLTYLQRSFTVGGSSLCQSRQLHGKPVTPVGTTPVPSGFDRNISQWPPSQSSLDVNAMRSSLLDQTGHPPPSGRTTVGSVPEVSTMATARRPSMAVLKATCSPVDDQTGKPAFERPPLISVGSDPSAFIM